MRIKNQKGPGLVREVGSVPWDSRVRSLMMVAMIGLCFWLLAAPSRAQGPAQPRTSGSSGEGLQPPYRMFLPWQGQAADKDDDYCYRIPGTSYETLTVLSSPTDRPAHAHADLNLALRGYVEIDAHRGYVLIDGPTDERAPHLASLFSPPRRPAIAETFQVYDWNWDCNCLGGLLARPTVTLMTLSAVGREVLYIPNSGYGIGDGYEVLVLYADAHRITLKYSREDNVVRGYTLHLENICVEGDLLSLYHDMNEAGRRQLPALAAGQPFARARSDRVGIAIRDTGQFMDPRSLKDWW